MYEYMNRGMIAMTGLMVFMLIIALLVSAAKAQEEGKSFENPYGLYFFTLAAIGMLFWDATGTKEKVLTNRALFKSNHELRCSVFTNSYLVSKPKGWYFLDKESLSDGNVIVNIQLCEKR